MGALLRRWSFSVEGGSPAAVAARHLLRRLGATVGAEAADPVAGSVVRPGRGAPSAPPAAVVVELQGPPDPVAAWAGSGAMWLTGRPSGPPLAPGATIAPVLHGAAAVLELLTSLLGRPVRVDGPALLGERAAMAGLFRRGDVSPGGSSRLVPCADGWLAVNLARPADIELLPAWLSWSGPVPEDPWSAVGLAAAAASASALAARAQLLGLPAAAVPEPEEAAADDQSGARGQDFPLFPFLIDGRVPRATRTGPALPRPTRPPRRGRPPLVVDLTSMWAGPLCAHLLGLAGARVIKVESTGRPDGARLAPSSFFDLLHAGHESVALDFSDPDGAAQLRHLVAAADVVVEGSRPRALAQLGLRPDAVLTDHPSATWVSITGYGRTGPWSGRVAFGDDAGAAAGLVAMDDGPVFCADAVADPVSGLYAAIGAVASLLDGGGHLVDVSMRDCAGHLLAGRPRRPGHDVRARPAGGGWQVDTARGPWVVALPRHRTPAGAAAPLGAHTAPVLAELGRRPPPP